MPAPGWGNSQRLVQTVWNLFDLYVGCPTVDHVAKHCRAPLR